MRCSVAGGVCLFVMLASEGQAQTTAAPSWAKRRADARPTPDPAPVMTATRSRSSNRPAVTTRPPRPSAR